MTRGEGTAGSSDLCWILRAWWCWVLILADGNASSTVFLGYSRTLRGFAFQLIVVFSSVHVACVRRKCSALDSAPLVLPSHVSPNCLLYMFVLVGLFPTSPVNLDKSTRPLLSVFVVIESQDLLETLILFPPRSPPQK